MNVVTFVNTSQQGSQITEVIPYSSEFASNVVRRNASNADALEAVKLDPAVLEAQVALEPAQRPVDLPLNTTQMLKTTQREDSSKLASFERAVNMQKAALLSLTPGQYELLMKYVATLRTQRVANQMNMECAFCKNNGESLSWYSSHALKNWRGQVQCPVLRAYHCPRCGASGDRAHTAKYCPEPLLFQDKDLVARSP